MLLECLLKEAENMKKFVRYSFLLCMIFHAPITLYVQAQEPEKVENQAKGLFLCEGVWQNSPCDNPETSLPYQESNESSEENISNLKKRQVSQLLHSLRMKSLNLKREYQLDYDISPLQQFCEEEETPLSECRNAMMNEQEKIMNHEIKLKEIERKKEKEEEESKEDQSATTTINQPQVPLFIPAYRYRQRWPRHIHNPHTYPRHYNHPRNNQPRNHPPKPPSPRTIIRQGGVIGGN